ncbi:hypothetical protein B0H13DRAFT_1957906 [Mycena leptocephala]|nr:hypothetical protein B0H13DRAFT_1957906 [Mycena leptocephala]
MIPRFSNPHFIPRAIESVAQPDVEELELQDKLDELIQSNLDADVSVRVKKRRKLNPTAAKAEDAPETSVLFRLLSTSHTISLLPRPPPPPVTREPECEDTESAAETRRHQAAAAAVDAAWVMQQSTRVPPVCVFLQSCKLLRWCSRFVWDASSMYTLNQHYSTTHRP